MQIELDELSKRMIRFGAEMQALSLKMAEKERERRKRPLEWTTANVETAMCLWEAMQDRLRADCPLARALVEKAGTPSARHAIMAWVPECEAEWKADRKQRNENEPYDWEHCPAFLERKLTKEFPDITP